MINKFSVKYFSLFNYFTSLVESQAECKNLANFQTRTFISHLSEHSESIILTNTSSIYAVKIV